MPVRFYGAKELPREVPGAVFCDGEQTVVLINSNYLTSPEQSAWLREVVNSLFAATETQPGSRLSAVV